MKLCFTNLFILYVVSRRYFLFNLGNNLYFYMCIKFRRKILLDDNQKFYFQLDITPYNGWSIFSLLPPPSPPLLSPPSFPPHLPLSPLTSIPPSSPPSTMCTDVHIAHGGLLKDLISFLALWTHTSRLLSTVTTERMTTLLLFYKRKG